MTTRSGWIQEYNAQVAVSDDHLILATALTQQPVDTPSFEPMMRAAIGAANILNTAHDTLGECEAADAVGIIVDAGWRPRIERRESAGSGFESVAAHSDSPGATEVRPSRMKIRGGLRRL